MMQFLSRHVVAKTGKPYDPEERRVRLVLPS